MTSLWLINDIVSFFRTNLCILVFFEYIPFAFQFFSILYLCYCINCTLFTSLLICHIYFFNSAKGSYKQFMCESIGDITALHSERCNYRKHVLPVTMSWQQTLSEHCKYFCTTVPCSSGIGLCRWSNICMGITGHCCCRVCWHWCKIELVTYLW